MFLGIEIGGTKLQLGVSDGRGTHLVAIERRDVDARRGSAGILENIEAVGTALLQKYKLQGIGIGFGGPVNSATGIVTKSHQVDGWDDFPLVRWCQESFQLPAVMGNDCDVAALAEARLGAGRGSRSLLYVTVGTGVGGGLVIEGKVHGSGRPAVAEIGHLRPGLHDDRPEMTVESHCSGWGIAATALARISGEVSRRLEVLSEGVTPAHRQQILQRMALVAETEREYIADLLQRCEQDPERLTAKIIAQAAQDGNDIARDVYLHATQVLGWAIAQTITLVAPEVVVVGGGVSLAGDQLFFEPLAEQIERYVFPALRGSYRLLPAELGELTVVHGALALAANSEK
ncbi:Putative fructokinase [Anatilimnocola aggregata]|uniref:Fructokinase n=1 Tax=Anatilimnocola aggregata TaxID=2528021 RepID=A0A517YKK8_9BACT|nr:ROK family protein [Anatilimnocola aggregata]QDU30769.1 Putative fructokinase [Anatilimnocola aggregata]